MAVKFLEPGGDADFGVNITTSNGFWDAITGSPSVATDFVHGGHVKSIQYAVNSNNWVRKNTVFQDAGARVSFYLYVNARPSANSRFWAVLNSGGAVVFGMKLSTLGKLFLVDVNGTQIGATGATLSNATWYRISIAYTLTSTTVNEIRTFVDGVADISNSNYTFGGIGTSDLQLGNPQANLNLDIRSSDHYIDNSNALTDPGNIWVTAKRPNANGTTNGFDVQIGAGGSGYGTGHSPQVNERALNTANGWSVAAVAATTEEYNIEGKATGDIDISAATIIDYMGWVSASSVTSETAKIIISNVLSNISLTSSSKLFSAIAGSSTYPAGSGTDIGVQSDATATTVGLYECGIIVAYIPGAATTTNYVSLPLMGCGIG